MSLPLTGIARNRWLRAGVAAAFLLTNSGCAMRFEDFGGGTWIAGFSRRAVDSQALEGGRTLLTERSQAAPLEVGIGRHGIDAGIGIREQTLGFVVPDAITNRFVPLRELAWRMGGTNLPWRLGFVHYRIPRDGSSVRLQVSTVKGGGVRLNASDPEVRLGYSRTTITTVPVESIELDVQYGFGDGPPEMSVFNVNSK